MKYLGPEANKTAAYGVASVSGSILAVCSCTVLPLFGGIYRRGAGLGPAVAFLYSGPAINVLAIVLTAKILGMELGVARAVALARARRGGRAGHDPRARRRRRRKPDRPRVRDRRRLSLTVYGRGARSTTSRARPFAGT